MNLSDTEKETIIDFIKNNEPLPKTNPSQRSISTNSLLMRKMYSYSGMAEVKTLPTLSYLFIP
jgi:hypothetical protein